MLLEVKDLCCIKQERCLFENLNFSINSGEIVQIEGPNGAGKTSLIRILAGLSSAEKGSLIWRGEALDSAADNYLADLLYIGHKTGVNTQLTALENITFWQKLNGFELPQRPLDLLDKLGLVGLEDVPVRTLSAGQQRRVAYTRLWLSSASIWLLDEPFTALDKNAVALLQSQFEIQLSRGGAIILTTHQDLTTQFECLKKVVLEYRF